LVVTAWTSRHSWTLDLVLVGVGLGLGEGLLEPDPVGLGEGEADFEGLLLGLDEAPLLGEDEALLVAFGVAVALLVAFVVLVGVALAVALAVAVAVVVAVALAVADAWAVAEALVLAEGEAELLDLAFSGVLDIGSEATSKTTTVWPAGTVRAAEVAAGGWPHTLGAATRTVLASAAVPPRRPPAIPEETMAALATMPNAEAPDRADFMAAPSSPWSSSSRPRVSSDSSDRPCAETIPCCRSSTHAPRRTVRERWGLPASWPEY
jgi:hypothetical protein